MSSQNFLHKWLYRLWLIIILGTISEIAGISGVEIGKAVKSSSYRTPTGDFLLPQAENENFLPEHHGTPQHFEELRSIHKIKDRVKREAILEERIVRVVRSPQLPGKVDAELSSGSNKKSDANIQASSRGEKAAAINSPGVSADAKFDASSSSSGKLEIDEGDGKQNVGDSKLKATVSGTGGGEVGTKLEVNASRNVGGGGDESNVKVNEKLPVDVNENVEFKGGTLNVEANEKLPVDVNGNVKSKEDTLNVEVNGKLPVDVNGNVESKPDTLNVEVNGKLPVDVNENVESKGDTLNVEVNGKLPVDVNGKAEGSISIGNVNISGNLNLTDVTTGELSVGANVRADLNVDIPNANVSLNETSNLNPPLATVKPGDGAADVTSNLNLGIDEPNTKLNETELLRSELPTSTDTTSLTTQSITSTKPDTTSSSNDDDTNESEDFAITTTKGPMAEGEVKVNPKNGADLKVSTGEIIKGELLLPKDYESLQIPKPNYGKNIGLNIPGPLVCLLFLRILGISNIDEVTGSVSFDADITVEWIDGVIFDISEFLDKPLPTAKQVLKAQHVLSPAFLKKLWRPDLYMEDLIKVDQPTFTNKAVISLKFNKLTGFISYTVRMTVTVNCPMSFEYYPADTQRCMFRFASYSYVKEDMSLDWLQLDRNHTGVVIEDDSEDNFDIRIEKIDKFEFTPKWNNPANNSYEVLTFSLAARRKISYHLIQTYLPSVFNIFVTWLVFLIPYSLYDCRIGTTMTTLLTLTAMFSAVREQSPQVNYIKAIDLWMLACVLFIFSNLVELTVMTWMRITIETFEEAEEKIEDVEMGKGSKNLGELDSKIHVTPWKIQEFRKIYSYISQYSFRMFAAVFVGFNIVYWTWLFVCSEYFNWETLPVKEL